LPVLLGAVDPLQKADALLLARDVEEQLDDLEPVVDEPALPLIDLLVATGPDAAAPGRRREPLVVEELRVHAHDEHLLVVGAVEEPDLPARREVDGVPPQEVVA